MDEHTLFARIGEALYGDRWQTDLSRNLQISDRTVRRWIAGSTPLPPSIWVELSDLITERRELFDDLAIQLAFKAAEVSSAKAENNL